MPVEMIYAETMSILLDRLEELGWSPCDGVRRRVEEAVVDIFVARKLAMCSLIVGDTTAMTLVVADPHASALLHVAMSLCPLCSRDRSSYSNRTLARWQVGEQKHDDTKMIRRP